jgi:hypothetical protein
MKYKIWMEVCFEVDIDKELTKEEIASFDIQVGDVSYYDGKNDIYIEREDDVGEGNMSYSLKYTQIKDTQINVEEQKDEQ